MIKIRLSTSFPEWPLIRQTPGSMGVWDNCEFVINRYCEECDYWVVYEGLLKPEKTLCYAENTIFITGEPPTIKTYDARFLKQFATIITCHRNIDHPHVIYTQQGLPWMVGAKYIRKERRWDRIFTKDYDELKKVTKIDKNKLLSVICTSKSTTKEQRKRLEFTKRLASNLEHDIDVFIPGEQELDDKWDAIAGYKYHVSLENSSFPDYWTEKLSDAFLGLSYPFYYGCPNLADYFPREAFTPIDINDFEGAVATIEKVIQENYYEKSLDSLRIAKDLVLDKYNLFAMLAELCNNRQYYGKPWQIVLKPEYVFSESLQGLRGCFARAMQRLGYAAKLFDLKE